jgi:hypothetical protein
MRVTCFVVLRTQHATVYFANVTLGLPCLELAKDRRRDENAIACLCRACLPLAQAGTADR